MSECAPQLKECELELNSVRPDSTMTKVHVAKARAESIGNNIHDDEEDSKLEKLDVSKGSNVPCNDNTECGRDGTDSSTANAVADEVKDCHYKVVKKNLNPTDKKSPIKHLIAICGFSFVLLLMTFAYLRIALHIFCPYDEQIKTYIVIEKVEQCPVPIDQEEYNDTASCPFWKKCPEVRPEDLVHYVPAPAGKRHEMMCRDIYNILHFGATLLHPSILSYKTTMPSIQTHSPCPKFPPLLKKRQGGNILTKLFGKIRKFKKPPTEKESKEAIQSKEGFDWTLFVSSPLSLGLSSHQRELAKQVTQNLKSNLISKYPHDVDHYTINWFQEKVEKVPFGGKYSWWHPTKDKWGEDKEESGLRLVAAYLKIMNWPKNLSTNFPLSGLCDKGCPADFAISNTLEFREEYQPWKITPSVMHENRKGWVYVRGYSPTRYHPDPAVGGASILWMRPGLHKMEDPEYFSRAVIHALETCIADSLIRSGGKMAKCNIVLDCDDVGLSKIPPIGPTKRTLKMLQDHYPDKLGTFVISNLSSAPQMFLKVLLPLLPDIVRQKIHIIPNDNEERSKMLKELIHEDFIPTQYGGKDDYKFHAKEYYGNGRYKAEIMSDEESIQYYRTIPFYGP